MTTIFERDIPAQSFRFCAFDHDTQVEAGRARLYVIKNDLHEKPYGLLEDVFVHEDFRSNGVARNLVESIVEKARYLDCYKIIASVDRTTNNHAYGLYMDIGFFNWCQEIRMDLN